MLAFDPSLLARFQLDLDRRALARRADLFARKVARMSASPLAFLRGAAPLFYRMLEERPELAKGPKGRGWVTGDMHLENFGAFRTDAADAPNHKKGSPHDGVTFDLNDFDEAMVGPQRLDVLRLTTSLLLGGRELGCDGPTALRLGHDLLDAYVDARTANDGARVPPPPAVVRGLLERVALRTQRQALDARTLLAHGKRTFVMGDRYLKLDRSLAKAVPKALARYAAGLPEERRPHEGQLEILDMAFRVAGTGSLGTLRVAVLVVGKGVEDGAWIFDLKAEDAPSGAAFGDPWDGAPAERVVAAVRACVAEPPRMLGATKLAGQSMLVRRLMPQEDKLDLTHVPTGELSPLASHLGGLLGRAHRRGATKGDARAWSEGDRSAMLDRAVALAGAHEAAYLAWCKLSMSGKKASARRKVAP